MKKEKLARLSGWEFSADAGDGAAYIVKEIFPERRVRITLLTSHAETVVEIPFSVLKIIASNIEGSRG